jgi:uncharacterized membrane protein
VLLAFAIGIIAGLRTFTAPSAISWAARMGWLDVGATGFAFLGYALTPWIFSVLALLELVGDQLPSTPSRTIPPQFGARLVSGAFCGAALDAASGNIWPGLVAGVIGAVAGTLGGAAFRRTLSKALGSDPPAAVIEDAIAIGGALFVVASLP